MSGDLPWNPDADPPRDPALAGLLARARPAGQPVDAGRLEQRVMAAVHAELSRGNGPAVAWWEVTARWLPAAAAAGLAAVLLSGVVFAASVLSGGVADPDRGPPETEAVAQVIAHYPGDSVLATLISGAGGADLAPWSTR
jgi:hypothetical protein